MYEGLPGLDEVSSVDDATVVAAIVGYTRAEAAAAARRLAFIAELVQRQVVADDYDRLHWACDFWDAAAAEVGAAMDLTPRRASTQMNIAVALRERLPRIAALFADGALSARVVATIAWRTFLVDDEAIAAVDADLAEQAGAFGTLSDARLERSIDALVLEHDPDAQRRLQVSARSRDMHIGDRDDDTGTTAVWGRLLAHDAALLDKRLTAMIHQVCADDPRTLAQRRADAMGALADGSTVLACVCGHDDCPAANPDRRADSVIIHVIADAAAIDAPQEPALHGEQSAPPPPVKGDEPAKAAEAAGSAEPGGSVAASSSPPASCGSKPQGPRPSRPVAYLLGGRALPAPLLAELIATGATVKPLRPPRAEPEPRYRPSKALADFIRARDMTCRFPGCQTPADACDIDHAIPWPGGPTHPADLRCMCRKHHLLKTFYAGPGGWSDVQYPDGTIVWTAPAGQTYTTYPGSRIVFSGWNIETPPAPARPAAAQQRCTNTRQLMMPRRRRTRAQDRAKRIEHERQQNAEHRARQAELTRIPKRE